MLMSEIMKSYTLKGFYEDFYLPDRLGEQESYASARK